MYIVDYSNDYYGNSIQTLTFDSDTSVIDFTADKSVSENFKIHRINKYEKGSLQPHELALKSGRIVLVKLSLQAK